MKEPRILKMPAKKLIGLKTEMSLAQNTTSVLWQTFMPRRKEISNAIPDQFYSVQIYPKHLKMENFTPETRFEKWAALEVLQEDEIPKEMEVLKISESSYAVFIHKGAVSTFHLTMAHIFNIWMPSSAYILDNSRPHFELLGPDNDPLDPNNEEEVWIPIKKK